MHHDALRPAAYEIAPGTAKLTGVNDVCTHNWAPISQRPIGETKDTSIYALMRRIHYDRLRVTISDYCVRIYLSI